ncbi:MAG: MFS transporter [Chitinophagales bacterium]|nr:MFS transporter [Chitinophagales bacterium]MDW8427275.1 MFS transporter [Chitinophagales bacterium]
MRNIGTQQPAALQKHWYNMAVVVAALGYFVDVYDLLLFGIVRVPSLLDLGYRGEELLHVGAYLLNWQMGGMLVGGVLWGVWGDKKGRLSVLFGSIALYSIANILNGTVQSIGMYAFYRFIAGIGLAGELGAGITLVAEVMTKEHRGYGTTIVSAFGIFGAVVAAIVAEWFDWRTAYYIGGGLGLVLLILRISAYESGMFHHMKQEAVRRGDFLALLYRKNLWPRYLRGILIGVPIWFVIGILITFAPEFAQFLGVALDANGKTTIEASEAIMYHYAGAATGALCCGLLSQYLKSRKKALYYFLLADAAGVFIYFLLQGASAAVFYLYCFLFGVANGYWSVFITIASEQFGTNIRATVTTSTPNFVRGAVVPITTSFVWLNQQGLGMMGATLIVGAVVLTLAFVSLYFTEETYGKDLNYLEVFGTQKQAEGQEL